MQEVDQEYEQAFQIIAYAGDGKSDAMRAIMAAREGNFDEAARFLKSADDKIKMAHEVQFQWIQEEAGGNAVAVNVISIHAQDHLTMALVVRDLAEQMVSILQENHLGKKTMNGK